MSLSVLLLTIHLVAVGVLVGVVFLSLYYVIKSKSIEQLQDFIAIRRIGSISATIAILSGITMFSRSPSSHLGDIFFWAKMSLIVIDGLIAEFGFIHVLKKAVANKDTSDLRGKLLFWAIMSAVVIIAIIAISVYRSKA